MDSNVTTIDDLEAVMSKIIREYAEDTQKVVAKAAEEAAAGAVSELKSTSPKDSGEYRKSWRKSVATDTNNKVSVVVYNKGLGQITHLLEKGHAKVNGGRVAASPHIEPAAENAVKAFENGIKEGV